VEDLALDYFQFSILLLFLSAVKIMLNNRLKNLFTENKKVFSIFVTAGFPTLESTLPIVETLAESGVDLIELGIPFSDSIADGSQIQKANERALANGASLAWTLETLKKIRAAGIQTPIILMGSLNPIMRYGDTRFCEDARNAGADGVILPDLPLEFYQKNYREMFERYDLSNIFLVTSNTSEVRLREIDKASKSFIYAVSLAGVTGKTLEVTDERRAYLEKLSNMHLSSPLVVGFGIENREQFQEVTKYAAGGIVGSAFIRAIENVPDVQKATRDFVNKFL
jgi:tryptophan synthase alpha chain